MIGSQIDSTVGKREFELISNQDHMEEVWLVMQSRLDQYGNDYLERVSHYNESLSPENNFSLYTMEMIKGNNNIHDKYFNIFDMDSMDEYSEDTESFKSHILRKECDVFRNTLLSKSEALAEWKRKFNGCKSQQLYDTFYNMLNFAIEYDEEMDEASLAEVDTIEGIGFAQMEKDACYLSGVMGYGIVSNILNHMYPRVFPGNYKAGVYSLHFLTGRGKGVNMPSESSEFLMVKDDQYSKTGVIETEHNFFYPYETFGLYSLRIYRFLEKKIKDRIGKDFPREYRYLLTNAFYEHVTSIHSADIATLSGNDDILKFVSI